MASFSLQPQLIESFGYPVEEHEVITEDGYILNIHRIPHRRSEAGNVEDEDSAEAVAKEKKIPVLLGHCLVGSSAIYAFGPRENSLAYVLADQGTYNYTYLPTCYIYIYIDTLPISWCTCT